MKKSRDKKDAPVRVRHIDTDTHWDVPRDEYIQGRAAKWIEQQLQQQAREAADAERRKAEAEAKAKAAADAAVVPEKSRAELLAEIEELRGERTKLRRDLDDRDHRLKLRQNIIDELDAAVRMRGIHAEPLEQIANQLRTDQENRNKQQNRLRERNRVLFDRIRAGEQVDESEFTAPLPPETDG